MSDRGPSTRREPLPGDTIVGVTLSELAQRDALRSIFRGKTAQGEERAVVVLAPDRSDQEAAVFSAGAHRLGELRRTHRDPTIVRVYAVSKDGRACVTDLWTVGSIAELPALRWDLGRRLDLLRRLCVGVGALHRAGIVHGCLRPANVLLDDDLSPVVCEAGMFDIALSSGGDPEGLFGFLPYAAPEARYGMALDARTDVFSVGCLLHFLLIEREPAPPGDDAVPRLDSILAHAPAGLVRIARKCVLPDASQRYASMGELVADLDRYGQHDEVGTRHFEAKETNFTLSLPLEGHARPAARALAQPAAPTQKRVERRSLRPIGIARPPQRWIALGGLALLLYCPAHAYLAAWPGIVLRLGMAIGAGVTTLGVAISVPRAPALRASVAALLLALVFVLDAPGGLALRAATERLRARDPARAVAALKTLRAAGQADLVNAQLRGADLSGMDLTGACLDAGDFAGANLSHANLTGASLARAWLDDATLDGAIVANLKGLAEAHCSTATILPDGWSCIAAHPTPKPGP